MENISASSTLKNFFTSLIFTALSTVLYAQQIEQPALRVAFYNVENLFHPENDSTKNDEEFTPEGTRNWSFYRYHEKSNRMAKAILSIGEWEAPDIVGLAEVENKTVVEDLVNTEVLRKFDYEVVHYESPDRRGIDVALIFRKNRIDLIQSKPIRVNLSKDPQYKTRDMLYTSFLTHAGDTIHLLFCHWPSRYGGQAQSEPKRIAAAQTARKVVDSLFTANPHSNIVIAGDFNDEWNNLSLSQHLVPSTMEWQRLINLMESMPIEKGSHRYRGSWSYLDQILVSQNLMDAKGLDVHHQKAQVCEHEFLLEKDEKYPGKKPFRSFIGLKYHGGFSDHLPVYIDLITD